MEYKLIKVEKISVIDFYDLVDYVVDQTTIKQPIKAIACFDENIILGIILLTNQEIVRLAVKANYEDVVEHLISLADRLTIDDLIVDVNERGRAFFHDFVEENNKLIKKRKKRQFVSYDEVVDFINHQKDRVYSLDNFKHYMDDLANPQLLLDCLHIGGTNGKGSTTNYIKEVLKHAGYKVATFTSPALYSRLDIIRINDQFIDEATMVKYANRYVDLWLEYEISMFEIEVFIAIMYFIEHEVDYALFEVGLGGLLDATNIIHPLLAINTNIGMDHVDYLGHDYQSIALNKAGIVKEGVDYITGETKADCLEVFTRVCKEHHSNLLTLQPITNIVDGNHVGYCYRGYDVLLNTPAVYQVYNSALAFEALWYLRQKHFVTFSDDDLLQGMYAANWPGRFEIISTKPLIIIDGAHNKEGINAFFEGAKKYEHIKIIFSALKDKDYRHMIEKLLQLSNDLTICEFEHVRASDAKSLAEGFDVKVEPDYKKAIDNIKDYPGTVFVTGSLYFIAKVREYVINNFNK